MSDEPTLADRLTGLEIGIASGNPTMETADMLDLLHEAAEALREKDAMIAMLMRSAMERGTDE